jgi:hypothetical protein
LRCKAKCLWQVHLHGLSSADANDSFNTIDYALYANSGVGNKFVIYESGQPQHSTGVTYAAGDYMKVVRSGTQQWALVHTY